MSVFNQSRSNIVRLIFAGMFLVIAAQLFNLQIISKKYKQQAQENALFRKSVYPTRGIIYDRKGKAILNNTILYDLMVTPSQVRNIDTSYFCQLIGIDTAEFRRRVIDARMWIGIVWVGAVMAVVTLVALDLRLPGGIVGDSGNIDEARTVAFTTLVFAQLFARDSGFANWILSWFGVAPIDWRNGNWAAQVAIFSKFWAFLIATDACVASAAIVSSSSSLQACGAS